jgi:four helix bundle protein
MRDHKSLVAWQVSNEVARAVLRLCRTRWKPSAGALFDQLQRAALSVQLNVAEGYALYGSGRFRYHLRVAYGSAIETSELLELAAIEGVIPTVQLQPVIESSHRSERLLLGLLHKIEKR